MVQEEEGLELASLKKKHLKILFFLWRQKSKLGSRKAYFPSTHKHFWWRISKIPLSCRLDSERSRFFWFVLLCFLGGVVCFLLCFLFRGFLCFLFCLSCFSLAVQALSCSMRASWAYSSSLSRLLFSCSMGPRTCALSSYSLVATGTPQ